MKYELLIIDDDEISVMLTEILLEDSAFLEKPRTFGDGKYALEYFKSEYAEDTKYVVFLDINMPLMNGWEFLEQIQQFGAKHNIYVFMLSSSTDKADIDNSKNISLVKGYFPKPLKKIHIDEIQQYITK
jgi:CheY-like chemotaxis protein